jgi:hypothetical protein
VRRTYEGIVKEKEEDGLSREEKVNLARFRSGTYPKVRRWMVMVGERVDAECRLCGQAEETCEHLLMDCPAIEEMGHIHQMGHELSELVRSPVPAMALLSKILSRLR